MPNQTRQFVHYIFVGNQTGSTYKGAGILETQNGHSIRVSREWLWCSGRSVLSRTTIATNTSKLVTMDSPE